MKALVRPAIERAVQELLTPAIERAITISLKTSEMIVKKVTTSDFYDSCVCVCVRARVRAWLITYMYIIFYILFLK